MIFFLDILLLLNLIIAYKFFQNILAPPVMVGVGMFIASIIATSYYSEWIMANMLYETTMLLGGSTFLFTITCIFLKKKEKRFFIHNYVEIIDEKSIKIMEFFFVFTILLSVYSFIMKVMIYTAHYGSFMTFSAMIGEAREDYRAGEGLQIPNYIMWLGNVGVLSSFFSAWFLSSIIVKKKRKDALFYILIVQQIVTIFSGVISGSKGAMFDPLMRFVVIYLFVFFSIRKSYKLPTKALVLFVIGFLLVGVGFKSLSSLIGRNVEYQKNSNMFAGYIGAEIKNLDIYMHGHDGNMRPKFWGEDTFYNFVRDIDPSYYREPRKFQRVGNYDLGNVYTQPYSFHKDFGYEGVVFLTILVAFLSMYVYNKVMYGKSILFLFIYSQMALPLFMSFFSSRFTESIIRPQFVKYTIYLWIFIILYQYLFKRKKINKFYNSSSRSFSSVKSNEVRGYHAGKNRLREHVTDDYRY